MDLAELRQRLDALAASLQEDQQEVLRARLRSLSSVFPFSEYEYILMFLLENEALTFSQYETLRSEYLSANRFLDVYGLAPRIFGQVWAEQHLRDLDPRFEKASRELDPSYDGEYDLWLSGLRIEVKASRAINSKKRGNLVEKALRWGSQEPFWMNFQQLKPDACDYFVFVGVWVDRIVYWALSTGEARSNPYFSHQHRGGIEYQIGITHQNIESFERLRVESGDLVARIVQETQ